MTFSAFQTAALRRWPGTTVIGDGPHALHCPVTSCVYLFGQHLFANARAGEDCSNWNCARHHRLEEIKPAVPARAPRRRGIWE